jgi:hypothetical protein
MFMKKRNIGKIGSVSYGTMRPEDVIPRLCATAREYGIRNRELSEIERNMRRKPMYFDDCAADWDFLVDLLNCHLAPYMFFGAHPGDGSDFGFWPDVDGALQAADDGDMLKVFDTADVPNNYRGFVLEVNDHDNVTLWNVKRGGVWEEVWGCV